MKIALMLLMAGVLGFQVNASDRYKDDMPPMDMDMDMKNKDRFSDDMGKKDPFMDDMGKDDPKPVKKKSKKSKVKNSDIDAEAKPPKKSDRKSLLNVIKAAKARLDKACEKVDSIEDLGQQDEARSLCGSKDPFAGGMNDAPREDKFKDDFPREKDMGPDMMDERLDRKRSRDF